MTIKSIRTERETTRTIRLDGTEIAVPRREDRLYARGYKPGFFVHEIVEKLTQPAWWQGEPETYRVSATGPITRQDGTMGTRQEMTSWMTFDDRVPEDIRALLVGPDGLREATTFGTEEV